MCSPPKYITFISYAHPAACISRNTCLLCRLKRMYSLISNAVLLRCAVQPLLCIRWLFLIHFKWCILWAEMVRRKQNWQNLFYSCPPNFPPSPSTTVICVMWLQCHTFANIRYWVIVPENGQISEDYVHSLAKWKAQSLMYMLYTHGTG